MHTVGLHLQAMELSADAVRAPFDAYRRLWKDDLPASLALFLAGAKTSGPRGEDGDENDTLPAGPSLAMFERELSRYNKIASSLADLPTEASLGWIHVDAQPVRQALFTWVTRWTHAYTHSLLESARGALAELSAWIDKSAALLGSDVQEDEQALVAALGALRSVQVRGPAVEAGWVPLRDRAAMLARFGVPLGAEDLAMLDALPNRLVGLQALAAEARVRLMPVADTHRDRVRLEGDAFAAEAAAFCKRFSVGRHFSYEARADPYLEIDLAQAELAALEARQAEVEGRERLFELSPRGGEDLARCREELRMLKRVWDSVELTNHSCEWWAGTVWPAVDVEFMLASGRVLARGMKVAAPREAREWDVYVGAAQSLADVLAALPLVGLLRDPSIRPRHWKRLMRACGTSFHLDSKRMVLGSVLALRLHAHAAVVEGVAAQARGEVGLESRLASIDAAWLGLRFCFEPFEKTNVNVLCYPHAVLESLDEHETALLGMEAHPCLGYFEEAVGVWRARLAKVRAALEAWLGAQRLWCLLHAIYAEAAGQMQVGSAGAFYCRGGRPGCFG
jgi:dynein heavy chain